MPPIHVDAAKLMDIRTDERPGRRAAFFDRDGVINIDHGYIGSPDRFDLVDGASRALRACREAGFLVFIVTNQSGIARGYFGEADVERLHAHMRDLLAKAGAAVDDLRYCPHHAEGMIERYRQQCECRKPAPGMINDLVADWGIDTGRSFLVGDKETDMEAARAAGLAGYRFRGGDLHDFVAPILAQAELHD